MDDLVVYCPFLVYDSRRAELDLYRCHISIGFKVTVGDLPFCLPHDAVGNGFQSRAISVRLFPYPLDGFFVPADVEHLVQPKHIIGIGIRPKSGWHGTSAHHRHTDVWTAIVRCCPTGTRRISHQSPQRKKRPCSI